MSKTKTTKKAAAPKAAKSAKASKPAPAEKAKGVQQTGDAPRSQLDLDETKELEAARAKKAKAAPPVEPKVTGECPRGGDHEWTAEDGERYCSKCKEPAPTKATKRKAKATTEPTEKKLSAIDAAAKLLATTKAPMNCKELIDAMGSKGLWTSPGGKTPHATLYSAILREISTKGKDARFTKTERGRFAANR